MSIKLNGNLYIKYLSTYVALVLIPILILGVFYVVSFSSMFEAEVFTNVDKDLENISISVEQELDSFEQIRDQISFSSELRTMPSRFEPQSINELKSMLSSYKSTNSFIGEIYLCIPSIGYIITSSTSSELDYFTDSLLKVQGVSAAELNGLFTNDESLIFPQNMVSYANLSPVSTVMFSYPIYSDSLSHLATIVFSVSSSTFDKLVDDQLLQYNAQTIVTNEGKKTIFSVKTPLEIIDKLSSTSPDNFKDSLATFDDEYVIRSYDSAVSGFTYVTLIPHSEQTFSQISELNFMFLIVSLAVVALSVVAITFALRTNYLPLRHLHETARTLNPNHRSLNELTNIENVLLDLKGENTYLSTQLEDNIGSIKNSRIQKLLTNGYVTIEDFNMDCQELDMSFEGEDFFVTVTHVHAEVYDAEELGYEFREMLSEKIHSYYLYGANAKRLIMVNCCVNNHVKYDDVIAYLSKTNHKIHEKYGFLLTTGVGSFVSNTTKMSQSFFNASTALDYCFVKGKGQVIGYDEIIPTSSETVYPQQYFDQLKKGIEIKNETMINHSIDKIIEAIDVNNYPLTVAHGICFNVINLVANSPSTDDNAFAKLDVFALSKFETIQEIVEILKKWREEVNLHVLPKTPKKAETTLQNVVDYLDKNCLRSDFSIYEAAEHFGMSLPKFSQYYKEQTGQNVLDYTITRRMNEAARLLEYKCEDVKTIAEKVGYYNTSSFIRRFKQIYGVTPGDYRKSLHTKEKK